MSKRNQFWNWVWVLPPVLLVVTVVLLRWNAQPSITIEKIWERSLENVTHIDKVQILPGEDVIWMEAIGSGAIGPISEMSYRYFAFRTDTGEYTLPGRFPIFGLRDKFFDGWHLLVGKSRVAIFGGVGQDNLRQLTLFDYKSGERTSGLPCPRGDDGKRPKLRGMIAFADYSVDPAAIFMPGKNGLYRFLLGDEKAELLFSWERFTEVTGNNGSVESTNYPSIQYVHTRQDEVLFRTIVTIDDGTPVVTWLSVNCQTGELNRAFGNDRDPWQYTDEHQRGTSAHANLWYFSTPGELRRMDLDAQQLSLPQRMDSESDFLAAHYPNAFGWVTADLKYMICLVVPDESQNAATKVGGFRVVGLKQRFDRFFQLTPSELDGEITFLDAKNQICIYNEKSIRMYRFTPPQIKQ